MDRLGNVATPFTGDTVVVPDSVPPPGLKPMATVMLALEPVNVLLKESCIVTCSAGLIATPAVVWLVGCTVKPSLVAAAGVTLNGELDVPASTPEAAFSV